MRNTSKPNEMDIHRRRFVIATGVVGTAVLFAGTPALSRADELPHLTSADPTAQALGYNEDSTKIDETKYTTHKAGMACGSCNFFQGGTAAYGPCQLFPGKAVNAKGWCSGYSKKA